MRAKGLLLLSQAKPKYEPGIFVLGMYFGFFAFIRERHMNIQKIINNNIVQAMDDHHQEVVVMGRGIGYQARVGQVILKSRIEKIFALQNKDVTEQFTKLLVNIPFEVVDLANDTITYAKQNWAARLNPNIYVTLTDHINFALQRHKEGIEFENPILWEIKRFYPNEYAAGMYAIKEVKKRLHITLKDDEAGFIAMHFVNAEYEAEADVSMQLGDLLKHLEATLHIQLDEKSLSYERFITHLKFLIQRIYRKESVKEDDEFDGLIRKRYPMEYDAAKSLASHIFEKSGWQISEGEIIYLTIHIRRVLHANDQEDS